MLNPQKQENKGYGLPTNLKTPWKWEKRHWLLGIALVCVVLWLVGSQGKVNWITGISDWLPFIGGLALIGEQLVKFIQ